MEEFKEILHKIIKTPTSPNDLYKIAGRRCNIYEYPELAQFNNIDELFEMGNSDIESRCDHDLPFDKKNAIIMYKSSPDFGHWTIIKKIDDAIHFLDSYGDVVDDCIDNMDSQFNKQIGQDRKYLAKLLLDSDKDVYYNHNPLQELNKDVNTCGHYCALFLKYKDLEVDDFAKLIKKLAKKHELSNDMVVALLSVIN